SVLAVLIALEHVGFLVLEMFLWRGPIGQKVFRQSAEQAAASATLAMNQGLYNGFLAAGLVWGLARGDAGVLGFCFGCVAVAGIFGAATVTWRIFVTQALPALIALALLAFT